MAIDKVWVRRPNGSPTRIQIPSSVSTPNGSLTSAARDTAIQLDVTDDFLVDDLREVILKKYPQSLGKHHDSADLSIRIDDPERGRVLAPDESVGRILMEEYPDGQKSSEAWTIITSGGRDNYTRCWLQTGGVSTEMRTYSPTQRLEAQEYFPYTPQNAAVTPPGEVSRPRVMGQQTRTRPPLRANRTTIEEFSGRMVVEPTSGPESVTRGQLKSSPNSSGSSPSQRRSTPPADYAYRPRTYSKSQPFHMQLPPQQIPSTTPKVSSPLGGPPILPPPRVQDSVDTNSIVPTQHSPPTSPDSGNSSRKVPTASSATSTSLTSHRRNNTATQPAEKNESAAVKLKPEKTVLGVIPPINVLIVEDNMINAQILEAFFRKRKLKYATAVNGKEAVEKWRQGGWHLMDIQLPVMSGIEATKEIRRLERVNHIGVFSENTPDVASEDKLGDRLFPSPVIIVALTASSRESDRNEALAAGCNDFLTKPVGAPWLERKAIEWGCMQALIWTSFERKKRTKTQTEEAQSESKEEQTEKPSVSREDSGDSIRSTESGST